MNNNKQRSIEIEDQLLRLIEGLMSELGRYKKKMPGIKKGFLYYFIKSHIDLGYCLPGILKYSNFNDIMNKKGVYKRLMKTLSAKFSRMKKGSNDVIADDSSNEGLVNYPTLASSLNVVELYIITKEYSILELIKLFRGDNYVRKYKEYSDLELIQIFRGKDYTRQLQDYIKNRQIKELIECLTNQKQDG